MTLVLQSAPPSVPRWMGACLASVAAWASARGFAYERVDDDALFAGEPASLGRLPRTDAGRLSLMRARLDAGCDRVVWVDADVVVFDPAVVAVDVAGDDDLGVCREVWVTGGAGGSLRTLELVCNAVLVACAPGRRLDEVGAETARRIGDAPLHERALGPDLFSSLHRARPFPIVPGWGLLSPMVVRDVAAGGGPALDVHARAQPVLGAANLCASMADDEAVWEAAVDQLIESGSWPLAFSASLHASQTGSFFGSRDGTNTAPHSASSGVPST